MIDEQRKRHEAFMTRLRAHHKEQCERFVRDMKRQQRWLLVGIAFVLFASSFIISTAFIKVITNG